MTILRRILLLVPALAVSPVAVGPASGHVTGVAHPGGPLHPILGLDHLLVVLAVAVCLGALALWRR